MFCPKCGNEANDEVKFCRKCGANLQGVQEAMTGRGGNKTIDWDKTWVKEMLLSQEERERRQGITPEVKRMNEIKGGVITTAAGIGAMIFLYFFLGAVAANEGQDAAIVSRVWLAGLVPFLVGLALIFNGLFVSKRIVKLKQEQLAQEQEARAQTLTAHTTNQLPEVETPYTSPYSVTERTTYHLPQPPNREMQ
jgi:hypothetical protein